MAVEVVPDTASVTLDLIELSIKGQYIGRSDMWRLRKQLIETAVFLGIPDLGLILTISQRGEM